MKLAINGFGRIGRSTLRALHADNIKIVAINDLADVSTLAHLLKYDSVYGKWEGTVKVKNNNLIINGKTIKVFAEKDPQDLPWEDLGVDLVIESTGFFTSREGASKHFLAGAKKVIISTNAPEADISIVLGVNQEQYNPQKHHLIAGCSCTTNCAAPVAKVLLRNFGIVKAHLSTVHAYTSTQKLVDGPSKDLRRARAAALSIVPTTTGAARAVIKVLPELEGRFDGVAFRVPVPCVSVVDLVAEVEKNVSIENVNQAFKKASETDMKGILAVTNEPLVSADYVGNSHSAIVDLPFTKVVDSNLVKVLAWYDNEYGYACRLIDLVSLVGSQQGQALQTL